MTVDPAEVNAVLSGDLGPGAADQGNPGHDTARAIARRVQAVDMRIAGARYADIAEQFGYTDPSTARGVVMRSLRAVEAEKVGELRELENARLDLAQQAIWPKVLRGDPQALNAWIRLSKRRADLNGLDAPKQVIISSGTQAALEDALADLQQLIMGEDGYYRATEGDG